MFLIDYISLYCPLSQCGEAECDHLHICLMYYRVSTCNWKVGAVRLLSAVNENTTSLSGSVTWPPCCAVSVKVCTTA